jgi:hypothetical protein
MAGLFVTDSELVTQVTRWANRDILVEQAPHKGLT